MTAEFRLYLGCYHIGKNGWCKSGRIGIDQEEKRIIAEQLAAQLDKRMYLFFDLPDLALWSSAVGWWVHNDRIIAIATADLTFYEFHTVINDPADRSIFEYG